MMIKKLFRFNVEKETGLAIGAGVMAIVLSYLLNLEVVENTTILYILVRDWLMIIGVGVVFVLYRIKNTDREKYGLSLKKWKRNLLVNSTLGILLAFVMLMDLDTSQFTFNLEVLYRIIYIMVAGIFEVLLFYTYQRMVFEKAFGKVPAALLVAMFYSFHHVGFQPEFIKLVFVGLLFVIVVMITNSALSIYPFYWGVGAVLDVLIQSENVKTIKYPGNRSAIMIGMIGVILIMYILKSKRSLYQK